MYDGEDAQDYYDPEVEVREDANRANGDDENIVVSGDPAAAATAGKLSQKSVKDMKIPDDERTTTPYMTKYERARILGTRALQIRCDNCQKPGNWS